MNLHEKNAGWVIRKQFKNIRERLATAMTVKGCIYCDDIIPVGLKHVKFEAGSSFSAACHIECYKDDPEWYVNYEEAARMTSAKSVSLRSRKKMLSTVKKRTMDSKEMNSLLTSLSKIVLEFRTTYLSVGLDIKDIDTYRGGYRVTARIGDYSMEDEFFHYWPHSILRNRILELIAELGTYVRKIEDKE